ncbi:MAG TPA: InlB B-repeat-containing protein, partial [Bacteroidales bacterium]|nr:InlB B-repeat-containing protein [Bacteroidales bacterium]
TSSSGCDSVVTLHLTILPNLNISFHANGGMGYMAPLTVCLGDYATLPNNTFTRLGYSFSGWSTTPNGAVMYQDGAQIITSTNLSLYAVWSSSCSNVHHTVSATACDSYYWRGNTYTNSGTYTSTASGVVPGGCDSIYTLNLTINHSVSSIEEITACNSYTWHGNTYTASTNTPTYTTTSSSGCDSVVTLHLTILPNLTISFHANGGIGYMAPLTVCLGNYATLPNNTFTRLGYSFSGWSTAPNGAVMYQDGAQIITSTDLSLYAIWTSSCSDVYDTLSVSSCDFFTWRGITYTNSGTYTSIVTDVVPGGCDSIYTLNLTINHGTTGIDSIVACDSYTWFGNTYTSSNNTATVLLINSAGCDSLVTLNLTINYSTSSEFWITEEDSYTWNGITYNETGDYVQVLATVDGCDSTVTLHLTITVGIDEPQTSIVPKVHPNPTSGIIIVDSDIIDRIDIYDNLGRMIRSFNNDNTINIQDLPPAVYILRVITPNNTTIHRIIKN